MQEHYPKLDWQGAVPIARKFDDPYFSLTGGLDETRHVFLQGNRLPDRFFPGFHIAELGFGTGLNAFAALDLWRLHGTSGQLKFTTFERFPMAPADMARALTVYPHLAALAAPFLTQLANGVETVQADDFVLAVVQGDARRTLPHWNGWADAWFLDGFSPSKNPELWEPALMSAVACHTRPGGTAATYSAAGHVRRALGDAGFDVDRVSGFGSKRHMTVARLP